MDVGGEHIRLSEAGFASQRLTPGGKGAALSFVEDATLPDYQEKFGLPHSALLGCCSDEELTDGRITQAPR